MQQAIGIGVDDLGVRQRTSWNEGSAREFDSRWNRSSRFIPAFALLYDCEK